MTYVEVKSAAELRGLIGEPGARAVSKERKSLHEHDRAWLAASPFCLIATAGADGTCDVSPKGDPPGFTMVLDDTTGVMRVGGVQHFVTYDKRLLQSATAEGLSVAAPGSEYVEGELVAAPGE